MIYENYGDTNCNWCGRYSRQRIGTGNCGLGNKKTSGDHPNYIIVDIGHILRRVRRLEETETPMRNYQLKLPRKTLKG